MARLINENSSRQQVFTMLGDMIDLSRKEAVGIIREQFDLKPSYAATLYQQHRHGLIEQGLLVETFTVREKDNRPVIVSHFKAESALNGDHMSVRKALSVYKRGLEVRLRAVEKLQSV